MKGVGGLILFSSDADFVDLIEPSPDTSSDQQDEVVRRFDLGKAGILEVNVKWLPKVVELRRQNGAPLFLQTELDGRAKVFEVMDRRGEEEGRLVRHLRLAWSVGTGASEYG